MADPGETTQASGAPASVEASELLGAVRALSDQVGALQTELNSLRSTTRQLPAGDADVPGWEPEAQAPVSRDGSAWLRSISSPRARGPAVPRLVLEIVFLVAVACLAAVARLDTWLVIVLMVVAWALVVLAEWAADRAVRLRNEAAFGRYGGPGWFAPSPQRTPELPQDTAATLPAPRSD